MKRYNASRIQVQWPALEVCGAGKLRSSFEEELGIESWDSVAKAGKGSKKRSVDGKL
jgi:hypothetical protein